MDGEAISDSAKPESVNAVSHRGRAAVWLACGAAVMAVSAGAIIGVAAHPADSAVGPDRSVEAFFEDRPSDGHPVELVDFSQDRYPAPHLVAWVTSENQYCVAIIFPAPPPDGYAGSASNCIDPSSTPLAAGRRGLIALNSDERNGNQALLRARDRTADFDVFGFVRGAVKVTATWDGQPFVVRLAPLNLPDDPELSAVVVESPPSARSQRHTYRIIAYDASGAEIGQPATGDIGTAPVSADQG